MEQQDAVTSGFLWETDWNFLLDTEQQTAQKTFNQKLNTQELQSQKRGKKLKLQLIQVTRNKLKKHIWLKRGHIKEVPSPL